MSEIVFELDWYKDTAGYELVDHGKYGFRIKRKGGPLAPVQPLRNDRAFKAFANIASAAELLSFISNNGFLDTYEGYKGGGGFRVNDDGDLIAIPGYPVLDGEDVAEHLASARQFSSFLRWINRRGSAGKALSEWIDDEILSSSLASAQVRLGPRKLFQIALTADTLMAGLRLQLVASVSGMKFNTCRKCGTLFEVGPGTGRRDDSKYCSDEHRIVYNSLARKKATR